MFIFQLLQRKDKVGDIKTLEDLANSSLKKLGMGDAKAIALGKSGEQPIDASGQVINVIKLLCALQRLNNCLVYLLNGEGCRHYWICRCNENQDKLVLLPVPEGSPEEVAKFAVLKHQQTKRTIIC